MPRRLKFLDTSQSLPTAREREKADRDRFYTGVRWRSLRARFLLAFPLCASCLRSGLVVEADTVHHVEERLDRPDLAYTWSNLESLCKGCHTSHHKRGGPR